jgi:hypothetical protein
MQHENDLVYLGRRAIEERRAAGTSGTRTVRDLHLELASAYEFRIHLLREQAALQAVRVRSPDEVTVVTLGKPARTAPAPHRDGYRHDPAPVARKNA